MSSLDFAIIGCYLGGVVVLGIWASASTRDVSGYLLGDRSLPWWALLGSIVATETSTATFLSIPGVSYVPGGDLRFLQLAAGFVIGRFLVVALLLPAYFRGEIFSAYQVLQQRFGGATQKTASLLFLIARTLGDGLRLFLAALVVQTTVGFSLPDSIVLVSGVTILYTLLGGMRSVVWNDCIQLVIYVTGAILALAVIVKGLPGGWQQLYEFAVQEDKLRLIDWRWDVTAPFTIWSGVLGGAFLSLGTHGTDQMMVQRYLSARRQADARRALLASGLVVFLQFALFLVVGIALAGHFHQYPPPQPLERGDAAFATFIVRDMPAGIRGLTLAAVLAAAMSTLASSLNSSAAAVLSDFGGPLGLDGRSPAQRLGFCRGLTAAFGVLQVAVALAAERYSESVVNDALAIAGFTNGLLLGVFALGVLTRRVDQRAALVAVLAGAAAVSAAKFATPIAWPWYTVIGASATYATGLIASHWLAAPRAADQ